MTRDGKTLARVANSDESLTPDSYVIRETFDNRKPYAKSGTQISGVVCKEIEPIQTRFELQNLNTKARHRQSSLSNEEYLQSRNIENDL